MNSDIDGTIIRILTGKVWEGGDEHKQAMFFAHSQGLDHNGFLEDTEITFIDKTDPSDPTRREEFWIDTLRTRYPLGLNNRAAYH